MALSGKLIGYVEVSSGGHVFHDVLRHKSHEVASIHPDVHGCDLIEGKRGDVGSVVCWNFTMGKFSFHNLEYFLQVTSNIVQTFPCVSLYRFLYSYFIPLSCDYI